MITQENTAIIIPARLQASRLPNKPLLEIHGKPMIQHVWERAVLSQLGEVLVATDSEDIKNLIEGLGGNACMTSAKRGDYGGLYARLAALCCERSASAPVTPELRAAAATQLCRERALALATVGTGVIAGAMAWYAWFSGGPSAKAAR